MNILHIHQDYPDGRPYPITKAVSNLIDACLELKPDDTHTVVSINRTSNPFKISVKPFEQGFSFVYWAIPLPFIYYWTMKLSAYLVYRKIKHLPVDFIHGHKLTCEGVFAYWLSKKINKPYVLSIRGGSDIHNIKRLSVHNQFFVEVFTQASQIFWVSAWAKKIIKVLLPIDKSRVESTPLLPNICNLDLTYKQKKAEQRNCYVTAISYHQYKRKGIPQLIQAISLLKQQGKLIQLDIYGSGKPQFKAEIEKLISKYQLQAEVILKGQIEQKELLVAMGNAKGFLMPAINETFGMAYVEALSVGCPVLYVGNTGVDGYFETYPVGEKIQIVNVESLLTSIEKMDVNNELLCNTLAKQQNNSDLIRFTSSYVAKEYLALLVKKYNV